MRNRQSTAFERAAPDPRLVEAALAHTRAAVFWPEDAGGGPTYPCLTADHDTDLVVVGGGYLGLWTAVLAKVREPGRRVALLESETIGWAASGRNGGFCEASLTHGESNGRSRWPQEYDALERLGNENLAAFERDVRELDLACEWERPGVLAVATEDHQLAELGADALDAARTREQISSPLFLGSLWQRDDVALLHPARLAFELARVAGDLGVEIFGHSRVTDVATPSRGGVRVSTGRARLTARQAVLATNVFPSLLRRNRLLTVPVYDYVLMTEPLNDDQWRSVGWQHRQGLCDLANQFHYSRRTSDGRILYGGYDAVYHRGGSVLAAHEDRPQSYRLLASHFLATFPQLEGLGFSHQWAGAIDTCSRFAAFHGLARGGRVAYAAGFTGLGVAATRFAAEVMLDRLAGEQTERTELRMVRTKPVPIPPEPVAGVVIGLTRRAMDAADHHQGRRNLFLRTLDAAGVGFDS